MALPALPTAPPLPSGDFAGPAQGESESINEESDCSITNPPGGILQDLCCPHFSWPLDSTTSLLRLSTSLSTRCLALLKAKLQESVDGLKNCCLSFNGLDASERYKELLSDPVASLRPLIRNGFMGKLFQVTHPVLCPIYRR